MANNLDKFYNVFTGLDTRSNKLLQSPGSFRKGSKNFKYDFQDQISNRNGLQHKDSSAPAFVDIFEYKYRNVDTGAAETEILGVATNGNLYRKLNSTLSFTATGAATSVSIYYDEVADTFKCVMNGLGSVTITPTMTLADLETALELLAGVTITVTGGSAQLAYLLDCVIEDTTFADNVVYYWEVVPFPDSTSVPFTTTRDYNTSSDYEGISSVNLNNCIYIADGGFPMKYDGSAVYRVGMPVSFADQVQPYSVGGDGGFTITASATPSGLSSLAAGSYKYLFRFGFTDYNGSTYYGLNDRSGQFDYYNAQIATDIGQYSVTVGATQNPLIKIPYFKNGADFGVFSCRLSADQSWGGGTGPFTISVDSGHNIVAGMYLMVPANLASSTLAYTSNITYSSYFCALVSSTTSTSITVKNGPGGRPGDGIFSTTPNNTTINGYWCPAIYDDKSIVTKDREPFGAFVEVYRSKVGVYDTFYYVTSVPMPRILGEEYSFYDSLADSSLNIQFDDSIGSHLPRACKYLSKWQDQLIQSGRPANSSLAESAYPSWYADVVVYSATNQTPIFLLNKYTESHLCDYQSVYWADALAPEGFPQDGLHEFSIDTKFADRVTGIAPNKDSLFAFKERSTAVLSGDLAQNDVVMEVLEADAGCISHKTIEEVRGSLVWLDSINGFYSCVAGRLPENIGFPIQDYQKINTEKLDFSQASAANFRKESLYVCSVGTTTFVFDYADNGSLKRNCWYLWDGFNGQSVLATSNDELLIFDGTRTQKLKNTKTIYDFTDHKTAISFILNTAWATQGFPTIDKHYVNLWINSIQGDFTLTVKQYGNFLEDQVASQSDVSFIAESSAKKAIKEPVKAYLPKLSAISFGMENSEKNKWVRIQGYEIQYSPDFNTGEPKR